MNNNNSLIGEDGNITVIKQIGSTQLNISLFKLWVMKTDTSIGIIGAGEGGRGIISSQIFCYNLLYYQHHSTFANMKKEFKKIKRKKEKNLQFIYAGIHQNLLLLDLLKVTLTESS